MDKILSDPWFQAITGGIIASALYEWIRRLFRRDYPLTLTAFGAAIGTVVFAFGQVLEFAVRLLLEGDHSLWSLAFRVRHEAPAGLFSFIFFGGLLPGVVTGLMVVKGPSLAQRIRRALLWAPLSLCLTDVFFWLLLWWSRAVVVWSDVYFSLLSNIFGGVAGGLLIASAVHLVTEWKYEASFRQPHSGHSLTHRSSRRRSKLRR